MSAPTPCVPCCSTPQSVNIPGTPGEAGAAGAAGANGVNAFTTTTADFVVPAISANVTVQVANNSWMTVGQNVFIEGAGTFEVVSKATTTSVTLTYLDYDSNTASTNNITSGAQVSPGGLQPTTPLTIAEGGTNASTVQTALNNLGLAATPLEVYAAGTAYSLTNVAALLNFGTTDPSLTITAAGTYIIFGWARIDYNAATFAANRTVTLKLRRTNNTAADLTNGSTQAKTNIITTETETFGKFFIIPSTYVTTNTTDIIEVWGSIDTVPTAGSIDAVEAGIVAVRIRDQTL